MQQPGNALADHQPEHYFHEYAACLQRRITSHRHYIQPTCAAITVVSITIRPAIGAFVVNISMCLVIVHFPHFYIIVLLRLSGGYKSFLQVGMEGAWWHPLKVVWQLHLGSIQRQKPNKLSPGWDLGRSSI
jgi:hypothetical protein